MGPSLGPVFTFTLQKILVKNIRTTYSLRDQLSPDHLLYSQLSAFQFNQLTTVILVQKVSKRRHNCHLV